MRKEKLEELDYLINKLKVTDVKPSTVSLSYRQKLQILFNKAKPGFINIESFDCTLADGTVIKNRQKIVKNSGSSSASIVLPIIENTNEVILTVQPRFFKASGIGVELPSGYRDKAKDGSFIENAKEAAIRELREETGYLPGKMHKLTEYYQDQGCSDAFNECFLATNCKYDGNQKLDIDEKIALFLCYYEEMLELVERGYINDAGSLLTIEKSKNLILKPK